MRKFLPILHVYSFREKLIKVTQLICDKVHIAGYKADMI